MLETWFLVGVWLLEIRFLVGVRLPVGVRFLVNGRERLGCSIGPGARLRSLGPGAAVCLLCDLNKFSKFSEPQFFIFKLGMTLFVMRIK